MSIDTPNPDALADFLIDAAAGAGGDAVGRRDAVKAENVVAAKYWGGIQWRMVVTFLFFSVIWGGVMWLGIADAIPLWVGLIINTVIASTFYMPMHEATHKNIWGKVAKGRQVEEVIGKLCSIPLGISFTAHRTSHMRHHAFTNDASRDPDQFTDGRLRDLPLKWLSAAYVYTFLPLIAFVPVTRKILHPALKRSLGTTGSRKDGLVQMRFWALTHLVLLVAFLTGFGLPALFLWYIPARLQAFWLLLVFAWYPHHPAKEMGRYVDTRVAVFPGSTFLIRGHDHHALHHLFPRVPHYQLPKLWNEMANDLVPRGVRSEGSAVGATGPVSW